MSDFKQFLLFLGFCVVILVAGFFLSRVNDSRHDCIAKGYALVVDYGSLSIRCVKPEDMK